MADQLSESSVAAAGQQGQAAVGKVPQDLKQAKAQERRPAKGKQTNRRSGKPGEPVPRLAEVGNKGTGFVKLVKDNFGFISSPDLDEQLFFHASEVLQPEGHEGAPIPFKDAITAGDEVEFLVGQNTGKRSNFVAKQVQKLPLHSVKAQLLSQQRFQGSITCELNSGQWRSEESTSGQISYQPAGDEGSTATVSFHAADTRHLRRHLTKGTKVEFNICTDNQTRELRAVHIEVKASPKPAQDGSGGAPSAAAIPTMLHGFVKTLKPQGGVIRCVEREERIAFKKSDVPLQLQEKLRVGSEIMFTITSSRSGGTSITGFAMMPPGSLTAVHVAEELAYGRIIRPISPPDAERTEEGLIVTNGEENGGQPSRISFSAGPLEDSENDAASLEIDDEVEFRVVTDLRSDTTSAQELRLTCKASEKRELGQIRTLKGNFGFIRCCQRSGDLFFHYTTLQGCLKEDLKKNDDVEFTVQRNPEHGTIAVRVCKMPTGSAVFETVSEQEYRGVVHSPVQHFSAAASTSGVIAFQEGDSSAKILFGEHDFKEKVIAGDHVVFRIANNINAAQQAQQLGAVVSRLVGRRAAQGRLLKLTGIVRQAKGTFGFLRYTLPQLEGGAPSEKSVFYHCSEVKDQVVLKPGDEATFGLSDNLKTKELTARRVVRTKEAPEEIPPPDCPQERTPQASKAVPIQPVRMPAMPDGTRGFTLGRGAPLKPPYPPLIKASAPIEIANGQSAPSTAKSAGTSNGIARASGLQHSSGSLGRSVKDSLGKAHSRSFPSITRLLPEGAAGGPPGSVLARTSSALNPAAATFMPKTSLS